MNDNKKQHRIYISERDIKMSYSYFNISFNNIMKKLKLYGLEKKEKIKKYITVTVVFPEDAR